MPGMPDREFGLGEAAAASESFGLGPQRTESFGLICKRIQSVGLEFFGLRYQRAQSLVSDARVIWSGMYQSPRLWSGMPEISQLWSQSLSGDDKAPTLLCQKSKSRGQAIKYFGVEQ